MHVRLICAIKFYLLTYKHFQLDQKSGFGYRYQTILGNYYFHQLSYHGYTE